MRKPVFALSAMFAALVLFPIATFAQAPGTWITNMALEVVPLLSTSSALALRWIKPTGSEATTLAAYEVEIQGGSYTSWTRVALVCVTSQSSQCTKSVSLAAPLASTSVSGLTASTSYTFRVRAVGSNSSGPWREVVGLTKPPKVTSFTVVRPTLLAGGSLRATVRLDVPGQNVEVRISRDSLSPGSYPFLDYPDTVTIQNGDTQVFDITTTEDFDNPGTTVRLKAFVPGTVTFGSGEEVARFTVEAAPVTLSMTLNPNSLTMGESARGELTLNQARPRDAAIALTSSHAAVKVPARVTLRAGETTRVFNIDASGGVTRDQQVTITAELGQTRATQRLTVTPMVASLDGITFTPQTAKSDTTVRVTVSLGAPAAVATVQIGTDYRDLAVPASIQFNRGEQTQTFELTAPTVDKTIVVSISAAIDRATTSANLTTDP